MKKTLVCAAVLTLAALPVLAQDKAEAKPAASAAEFPMPKPGPEHELLKSDVGTWDATVESFMAPGAPPMVSKGTETNTLMAGLWLVTDFKSDMMGAPFQGHGVAGWDPAKKKYVGTWADSMSTSISLTESIYDPASKTLTGWMEGPDMTGKPVKMKMVTEWKDADSRVFTIHNVGADGKENLGLRITYKRRK